MKQSTWLGVLAVVFPALSQAQTMMLSTSDADYVITNAFSMVNLFEIDVEIDAPLAPGVYDNPPIVTVAYRVFGEMLEPGTPSGFPSFDLRRGRGSLDPSLDGTEFYAQGGSLSFEILPGMDLSDGVQLDELAGNGVVLTFNAREMQTPRFHPPILELRSDGTGRIQNSNNMPIRDDVQLAVDFGEEYISDLLFDPGNVTIITGTQAAIGNSNSGCFIATAAYGSYLAPEVKLLRDFRDTRLLGNAAGRAFIELYYQYSPPVAAVISQHKHLRVITRWALTPIVLGVKYPVASGLLLIAVVAGLGLRRRGFLIG